MDGHLTYHNSFGSFSGANADAVLRAVHAESAQGLHSTYEEWWRYNQWLWRTHSNWRLPDIGEARAAEIFLDKMVEAGALIQGRP